MSWIPHTGVRCPVSRDQMVVVRLVGDGDGDDQSLVVYGRAGEFYWGPGEGEERLGRIEAYRLVTSETDAQQPPASSASRGVGDVNGTTIGSAARFNAGKVPYELVPARCLAVYRSLRNEAFAEDPSRIRALCSWGTFQMGGGYRDLIEALSSLDHDGKLMEDCARVFDYGRRKYSAWNWARGQAWSIPIASGIRHLLALIDGEENDPESGLPHRGHVACNAVMLLWFEEHYREGDDRFSFDRVVSTERNA